MINHEPVRQSIIEYAGTVFTYKVPQGITIIKDRYVNQCFVDHPVHAFTFRQMMPAPRLVLMIHDTSLLC